MNDDLIMFDFTDNEEVEIEHKEFEPLPAGEYPFTITQYERSIYDKQGGKIPVGCKVATVHFCLDASAIGRGEYTVKENYYLCGGPSLEWATSKIRTLFEGVGLISKEEKRLRIDFDRLVGMEGVLKLSLDPDKNDKSKLYNHVKSIKAKAVPADGGYNFG